MAASQVLAGWQVPPGAGAGATNDAAHAYQDVSNWLGNTIDDTLTNALTADTTLYFSADHATGSSAGGVDGRGMHFAHTGNFHLTLLGGGTFGGASAAPHTVTLNGDLFVNIPNGRTLTFGGAGNAALDIDLGGETRIFKLPMGGFSVGGNRRVVVFNNDISNGSLIVEAGATWRDLSSVWVNRINQQSEVHIRGATTYTGPTVVRSGLLTVNNAGSLSSSEIEVRRHNGDYGYFVVGDVGSTLNRLPDDATITLHSGRFDLQGQTGVATTEQIGQLRLGSGLSTINVSTATASGSATLKAGSLDRADTRATGIVLGTLGNYTNTMPHYSGMNPSSLGDQTKIILDDGGASLHLIGGSGDPGRKNKPIIPYLISQTNVPDPNSGTSNPGNRANTLVTYDPVKGLVPLTPDDYVTNTSDKLFPTVHADGNDNVRLSFVANGGSPTAGGGAVPPAEIQTLTISGNQTINALVLDVEAASGSGTARNTFTINGSPNATLTIKSGVIHAVSSSAASALGGGNNFVFNSNVTINFGDREGLIYHMHAYDSTRVLEFNGPLVGSNGLTFSGYNVTMQTGEYTTTIRLAGNNSGLTGPITVNSGTLDVTAGGANGAINPTSVLRVREGALFRASASNVTVAALEGSGAVGNANTSTSLNIGGDGTGGTNGAISLLGGTISPGDALFEGNTHKIGRLVLRNQRFADDAGSHTVVQLKSGSLEIEIDSPTAFDSLHVTSDSPASTNTVATSTLVINNGDTAGTGSMNLNLTLGYAPEPGALFKIIDVTQPNASQIPVSGQFSNTTFVSANESLLDVTYLGKIYQFSVLYNYTDASIGADGNDVVLRLNGVLPIPEPSAGLVLGLGMLLARRRRA